MWRSKAMNLRARRRDGLGRQLTTRLAYRMLAAGARAVNTCDQGCRTARTPAHHVAPICDRHAHPCRRTRIPAQRGAKRGGTVRRVRSARHGRLCEHAAAVMGAHGS